MERPYASIEESPEAEAFEAYEEYMEEVEKVGLPALSFEGFVARFRAPARPRQVVELPEEDDITW